MPLFESAADTLGKAFHTCEYGRRSGEGGEGGYMPDLRVCVVSSSLPFETRSTPTIISGGSLASGGVHIIPRGIVEDTQVLSTLAFPLPLCLFFFSLSLSFSPSLIHISILLVNTSGCSTCHLPNLVFHDYHPGCAGCGFPSRWKCTCRRIQYSTSPALPHTPPSRVHRDCE